MKTRKYLPNIAWLLRPCAILISCDKITKEEAPPAPIKKTTKDITSFSFGESADDVTIDWKIR